MILNNADDIRLGSAQVDKVYRGSSLVWQSSELPSGYTRCLYIKNRPEVVQWIDTNINGVYRAELDIRFEASSVRALIGQNLSGGYYFGKDASSRFELGGGICIASSVANATVRNTVEFERISNCAYLRVNGSQVSRAGSGNNTNFKLYSAEGDERYYGRLEVYGAKFYQNETLVRNYIPCLDSNGVPCFYEAVSKMPKYNDGTGVFLYGLA